MGMDLTESQIEEIESAIQRLRELDPTEVPEPAADLADLLSRLLGEVEAS